MTKFTKEELANLSGAYALDALDADEARAFEAELANSEQTRYEVTELRDTAVLLGLAVAPVQPSDSLKASIMGMLDSTPQLPAEDETDHDLVRRVTTREFELKSSAQSKANARWFTRPVVLLTSAAAALLLIVGGVAGYNGISTAQHQYAVSEQVNDITTASDYKKITTDVKTGGSATVMWSAELSSAAIKVDGVDVLPGSKTYELWYIGADGARPAGTFNATSDGTSLQVLTGTMRDGDAIGVSVEPAGGSPKPTTVVAAVATA